MARTERGRCIICDQRRVLSGSICRECADAEDETQRDHFLGMAIETAAQEAYQTWAVRSDQWPDRELQIAAQDGTLSEYIEKAYTAGFWQGAHARPGIDTALDIDAALDATYVPSPRATHGETGELR